MIAQGKPRAPVRAAGPRVSRKLRSRPLTEGFRWGSGLRGDEEWVRNLSSHTQIDVSIQKSKQHHNKQPGKIRAIHGRTTKIYVECSSKKTATIFT